VNKHTVSKEKFKGQLWSH